MAEGTTIIRDGVRVIQGTPTGPLRKPTLFLRILNIKSQDKTQRTVASLSMARPRANDLVIKELIPDMELEPRAALDKAIAIALRGEVGELYLNADMSKLPGRAMARVA